MSDTPPAPKRRLDPLLLPLFAGGAVLVLALLMLMMLALGEEISGLTISELSLRLLLRARTDRAGPTACVEWLALLTVLERLDPLGSL